MKINMSLLMIFAAIKMACTTENAQVEICPSGEEYRTCGTSCPKTCENKNDYPVACNRKCNIGCFCEPGLIRQNDSEDAPCIIEEACCPESMEYRQCGTSCPEYCGADPIRICTAQCIQGCFCKPGYVLESDSDDAECVLESECAKSHEEEINTTNVIFKKETTAQVEFCPSGEEYRTCGTSCPKTCENKNDSVACNRKCNIGCFCESGLIRQNDSEDAPCIIEEACCPESMEYRQCGTSCPEYCGADPIRICTAQCIQGCFCKPGYVLESDLDDAECVLESECAKSQEEEGDEDEEK